MKAQDFDQKFDQNAEDIVNELDLSTARRVNLDRYEPPNFS
jgi:hypothetical protein